MSKIKTISILTGIGIILGLSGLTLHLFSSNNQDADKSEQIISVEETEVSQGTFECNKNTIVTYNPNVFFEEYTDVPEGAVSTSKVSQTIILDTRLDPNYTYTESSDSLSSEYFIAISCSPRNDGFEYDNFEKFTDFQFGTMEKASEESIRKLSKIVETYTYDILADSRNENGWLLRDKEGYTISVSILNFDNTLDITQVQIKSIT